MPVTTRFQFEQGSHPPFNYTQLPPPTRCPRAPVSEDSSSLDKSEESKDSKVTPWHKGGFLFSMFKTPKSTDSLFLTLTKEEKYRRLQEHFEHRDNQARLDKEYRKNLMAERMNSRDFSYDRPETSRPMFGTHGNNGNITPPISPPRVYNAQQSPPRRPPSQHEEDIDDEELVKFQQDEVSQ